MIAKLTAREPRCIFSHSPLTRNRVIKGGEDSVRAWHGRTAARSRFQQKEQSPMIFGAHVILYSQDAEADRAFFRDILGFSSVDAGHGWLIFALPPGEAAIHPDETGGKHELYLMCDDLKAEIARLKKKNVHCSPVKQERWGSITTITLPGGSHLGLYEPRHASPLKKTLE
jgi:catechol 2,3-dioxygenase-like lactoylglutathione lyase family enzyme